MTALIDPPPPRETTRVIARGHTYATVTDHIASVVKSRPGPGWLIGILIGFALTNVLMIAVIWLFARGVGIWGIDIPVAWGFAIINFVWWIGIGHAGTFISAFLLLLRQEWRTSINRFAEAMTLFAVACAGMFPILHLGRPWFFYWLFPYPNVMDIWPQFRSPLVWDVFAVSTYATVSLVFWYVGLVPDLAVMRDRYGNTFTGKTYGIFALGWRGASRHWHHYQRAYLLLAGLAAPLVVSVHSIVGMDFAGGIVPGWHTTIMSPYFVAGAIFSGFAMVLTLAIPIRAAYRLQDLITLKHLENCAKLILVTGSIVAYGYYTESFYGWYSNNPHEMAMLHDRYVGKYAVLFWILIFCNCVSPQFLWIKYVRTSVPLLFILSLVVNLGMWLERFIIIVQSLHHGYIPSKWDMYYPTVWDWATFIGTLGFFLFLFLLFIRYVPAISISEVRELVHKTDEAEARHG
jgi:Ni/Fe-hydrogenase subunit HybB-like protein